MNHNILTKKKYLEKKDYFDAPKIKHVVLFIFLVLSTPWLIFYLGTLFNSNEVVITWSYFLSPAIIVYVFSKFEKQKTNYLSNIKLRMSLFAFLSFPALILSLSIIPAYIIGDISYKKPSSYFIDSLSLSLFLLLIKNISEELAWRGYLQNKLNYFLSSKVYVYAVTGIIWSLWHLPIIYLYPQEGQELKSFHLFMLTLVASSFFYGQITSIAKSLWPAIFLHISVNFFAKILSESVEFKNKAPYIYPHNISYSYVVAWILIALIFYRFNKYKLK